MIIILINNSLANVAELLVESEPIDAYGINFVKRKQLLNLEKCDSLLLNHKKNLAKKAKGLLFMC